jgi:DNA-binding response OmpR family regulator
MNQILILDDDARQLDFLKNQLSDTFSINTYTNPIDALDSCKTNLYDAIVIDLHMPIINGVDFINQFRKFHKDYKNIFILSADNSTNAKLSALNLGVIDFLWPEMCKEELVLRINNRIHSVKDYVSYKGIKIDLNNLAVYFNSCKIETTLIEFKLLKSLILNANQVISREELKNSVWPNQFVLDKTLNTHLTNLRMKFQNSSVEIKSIKNEGLILT